jgi:prepilin-type N-terminal cleavage/methylation domain-containing protein
MKSRSRAGFTLIELMVAMALTMFIMVILSQAFMMSLDTFSGMKGIGDMQIQLRTAEVILRDDLRNDHLEGKRRLSDLTLLPGTSQLMGPLPQAGFFAVRRSSNVKTTAGAPYFFEGTDASGMPSYRATDHMLYMTVKRKGNRQENFFTASLAGDPAILTTFFSKQTAYDIPSANLPVATSIAPYAGGPTGIYSSQWAEVLYYLVRTGSTEEPNNPKSTLGTPLYALYRSQFVMVPDATNVAGVAQFANSARYNNLPLEQSTFAGMSCNPGAADLTFFSPADAAKGNRVFPDLSPPFNPAADLHVDAAKTLVLPNVISFEVQIMRLGDPNFDPGNLPNIGSSPFGIYDTTKFNVTGYPNTGLKGIQITLRVWENTTRQTRQATIVQDL